MIHCPTCNQALRTNSKLVGTLTIIATGLLIALLSPLLADLGLHTLDGDLLFLFRLLFALPLFFALYWLAGKAELLRVRRIDAE
jgi:hypothetical protein